MVAIVKVAKLFESVMLPAAPFTTALDLEFTTTSDMIVPSI